MTGIQLQNVSKCFGSLTAVDSISFSVEPGEVLCLLGPSGCGKTTTLRMIAGLEETSGGQISLATQDVTQMAVRNRNVAMAFQFYALYPNVNVADNLAYPLHAENLSTTMIREKVAQITAILNLGNVLQRYPHQLSEGEKQRVSVGRCIIRDACCFLFDEPLSRLDVKLREEMRVEIKRILLGLSKPTVIVTHDQIEALTMGDRIAIMNNGIIEQIGTPQEIFLRPVNTFVAGFVGTPQMNLLPVVLESFNDGMVVLNVGGQCLNLQTQYEVNANLVGSDLTYGVRPRSVQIISEMIPGCLSATVELVEFMGAETLMHLSHPAGTIRIMVTTGQHVHPGEIVHFNFDADQICLFKSDQTRIGEFS